MKSFHLVVLAAVLSLGGSAFADTATTQPPPMVIKSAVGSLTVTGYIRTAVMNDNGTPKLGADGQPEYVSEWKTVTLKPGDQIPDFDPNPPAGTLPPTITVTAGSVDMQIGGKTISAGAGATFTVSNTNGVVSVSATGTTPVTVKTESGHNVVVTAGSEVNMTTTTGDTPGESKVEISVTKGNAIVSDSTGDNPQTIDNTSEPVEVSGVSTGTTETVSSEPRIVQDLPENNSDTKDAEESGAVSGSNP